MHFDATNSVTQGLLLADYLKSILTGQNLPSDLDAQPKGSVFYEQYNAANPQWLDRPNHLFATDLIDTFQTE